MTAVWTALDGEVIVEVDRFGVPVIHAMTQQDAFWTLGYWSARDRGRQMWLFRHQAVGELAATVGPGAVDLDRRQRWWGMAVAAGAAATALDPRHALLLDAYAAGVNRWWAEQGDGPGDTWSRIDSVAVGMHVAQLLALDPATLRMARVMRDVLPPSVVGLLLDDSDAGFATGVAGDALHRELPSVPRDEVAALLAEAAATSAATGIVGDAAPIGSNAWAVSGRRTADGRAILANDMHLHLRVPNSLYRAELVVDGDRRAGVMVPGLPVFLAGATDRLAWGVTRLVGDNMRLVDLPDGAAVATHVEAIDVHGAESQTVTVERSKWGPVTGGSPSGRRRAVWWATLQPGGFDLGLLDLLDAADVDEAVDVARRSALATMNVVVADGNGRVAWAASGRYASGDRTAPGPDDAAPFLAPDQLPAVVDPDSGFVVSANNGAVEHAAVGVNLFPGSRARRISEWLRSGPVIDEAACHALQLDVAAPFFEFYRDLALVAADGVPPLAAARAEIRAWDGTASVEARGLNLLVAFREALRDTLLSALLTRCAQADAEFRYVWHGHEGPLRSLLTCEPRLVPPPFSAWREFIVVSLLVAQEAVQRADGSLPRWGDTNIASIEPLRREAGGAGARPARPLPGCAETVCVNWPGFGAAVRVVVAPGHAAGGVLTVPGGQAEQPDSPHFGDHYDAWCAGTPMPFAAIDAVSRVVVRGPGGGGR